MKYKYIVHKEVTNGGEERFIIERYPVNWGFLRGESTFLQRRMFDRHSFYFGNAPEQKADKNFIFNSPVDYLLAVREAVKNEVKESTSEVLEIHKDNVEGHLV